MEEADRYLTVSQLEDIAVAKYLKAALAIDSVERAKLLRDAKRFAIRAKILSLLLEEPSCEIHSCTHH